MNAIANDDVSTFQRIKGIGLKTAQRLILELKDKLTKTPPPGSSISPAIIGNNASQEALSALVMLGFNRTQAQQALQKIDKQTDKTNTVEGLIKEALRHL